MRVGISTASLFMRQYNEEAVQTIKNLGVETCEIFLETFSEYTRAFGERKKGKSFRKFRTPVHHAYRAAAFFRKRAHAQRRVLFFRTRDAGGAGVRREILYFSRHGAL